MQLKPDANGARGRLIAASCALLSATAARGGETSNSGTGGVLADWSLDSALAYYHEDGRIQAIEPVVNVRKTYADGGTLDLDFTFDSLSGSSPNGALSSREVQTFASPSGKSLLVARHLYSVAPGELPVDPNYHDQRFALGADWALPLMRLLRASFGTKLSYEDDFFSASANAALARDFNQKNTTLSFGVNFEGDSLRPIGGTPLPLSEYSLFEKTGNKSKDGAGLLLSVTQLLSRSWVTEFNLSADRFSGYLNDPYKIVSVIDGGGLSKGYLYENRPDTRTRKSAYLENRVGWERASAALSLRYMTDSWDVHSQTAQLHVRGWSAERDRYMEPTVRWYRQTAANFYTPWLPSAAAQDAAFASADSRLGAFHALTYGLKYGVHLDDKLAREGSEFSVRIEYYIQSVDHGATAPGTLQGLDLYPSLKAVFVQVGFSY